MFPIFAEALPRHLQRAVPWLAWFDKKFDVHPMLVSFTTALFTLSLVTDIMAAGVRRRERMKESLDHAAGWAMCFAACITPFTALFGWFFWMSDDSRRRAIHAMEIHMWLGTSLVFAYAVVGIWRWRYFSRGRRPRPVYFAAAVIVFAAVTVQARIGGAQTFGGSMAMSPSQGMGSSGMGK